MIFVVLLLIVICTGVVDLVEEGRQLEVEVISNQTELDYWDIRAQARWPYIVLGLELIIMCSSST